MYEDGRYTSCYLDTIAGKTVLALAKTLTGAKVTCVLLIFQGRILPHRFRTSTSTDDLFCSRTLMTSLKWRVVETRARLIPRVMSWRLALEIPIGTPQFQIMSLYSISENWPTTTIKRVWIWINWIRIFGTIDWCFILRTSIVSCLICLNIIRWRPYTNDPMHQSIISVRHRQEGEESREERQFWRSEFWV